jgi:hypothetical protein
MVLYSPSRELSKFAFDYDWNNDGSLDLPLGVQVVDSLGVRTLGLADQVYGPTANILAFTATEVDSVSRKRNDSDRNDGSAWFGGNLTSAGDDYLLYEASSTALPLTGASLTPGDANTGTPAQSPLVSLTSITPNVDGTVTVTFNGNISQVLAGDGSASPATGSGISISDTSGLPIPVIDARPTVTGIGTNSLTLAFTGSGVVGGLLPAGSYQLNFVGNGFVANGRAVDVANNGTEVNGFREFEFTVTPPATLAGDYDRNGTVEPADHTFWVTNFGATSGIGLQADGNNNGTVDAADYSIWRDNLGATLPGAGSGGAGLALAAAASEEPVHQPLTAAVEPTLDFVDLAFADLASNNSASTTLSAKAAGADAAASRRFAAGGSAPFDHSLLLVARRFQRATGPELDEARCAAHGDGEFGDVDSFFSKLGEKFSARKGLRRAV